MFNRKPGLQWPDPLGNGFFSPATTVSSNSNREHLHPNYSRPRTVLSALCMLPNLILTTAYEYVLLLFTFIITAAPFFSVQETEGKILGQVHRAGKRYRKHLKPNGLAPA